MCDHRGFSLRRRCSPPRKAEGSMSDVFHIFPPTPHLLWLGAGSPRDDKMLTSAEIADFLSDEVIVEEKVDGANLGLSLGPDGRVRAQSRGNYLAPGRS